MKIVSGYLGVNSITSGYLGAFKWVTHLKQF